MLATGKSLKTICGGVWRIHFCSILGLVRLYGLYASYVKIKRPVFLRYESSTSSFLGNHECSVYKFDNAQLLEFHIVSSQLPPQKDPEVFSVWLPI